MPNESTGEAALDFATAPLLTWTRNKQTRGMSHPVLTARVRAEQAEYILIFAEDLCSYAWRRQGGLFHRALIDLKIMCLLPAPDYWACHCQISRFIPEVDMDCYLEINPEAKVLQSLDGLLSRDYRKPGQISRPLYQGMRASARWVPIPGGYDNALQGCSSNW